MVLIIKGHVRKYFHQDYDFLKNKSWTPYHAKPKVFWIWKGFKRSTSKVSFDGSSLIILDLFSCTGLGILVEKDLQGNAVF